MSQSLPPELIILALKIQIHFSLEEMNQLCFSLGIEPEDITGNTRAEKSREIVLYLHRRGRISELRNAVKKQRPNVDFDEDVTIEAIARYLPVEKQRELSFLLDGLEEIRNELTDWKEAHKKLDDLSNRVYGQYAQEVKNLPTKSSRNQARLNLLDLWDPVVVEVESLLAWADETKYVSRSSLDWFRKIETRYLAVKECLDRSPLPNPAARSPIFFGNNNKQIWVHWCEELRRLTRELGNEIQVQLSRADDKLQQTAIELGKKSEKITRAHRNERI